MITWIDKPSYFGESPQHTLLVFYDDDPLQGGTELFTLVDQTVIGTAYFDYACTALQKLEIGTAIATEFGCSLFTEDIPSGTRLGGLWVKVYSCISYSTPIDLTEWNLHGIYQIDGNPRYKNVVSITALDHMVKMDYEVPLTEFIALGDMTAQQMFNYICTKCGVTGVYTSGANSTRTFTPPNEQGMTYRQLLGWVFGIMGVMGYIDNEGVLRCRYPERNAVVGAIVGQAIVGEAVVGQTSSTGQPFDITFTPTDRFDSWYEDTVAVTGNKHIDDEGQIVTYGNQKYTFDLSYNPLVEPIIEVMGNVYARTKGIEYAPMTMTTVPCPWIVPMDWVRYEDAQGNYHYGVVTNVTHTINGHSVITCEGELC